PPAEVRRIRPAQCTFAHGSRTASASMCWRRIPHSYVGPDAGCTSKRSRTENVSTYTGPRRIQRPAEVVVPAHRPDGEGERILGRNRYGAFLTGFRAGGDLVA